jgi:hypothetical protein
MAAPAATRVGRAPPPASVPARVATGKETAAMPAGQSLELGRQITVDLKPYADFDECRSRPGHRMPFALMNLLG